MAELRIIALIVLLTVAPASAFAADCAEGVHYVTANSLNVRSQPIDGATVSQIQSGDQVEVLECRGDWARIAASQWVHSGFLSAHPPTAKSGTHTAGKAARFRELRDHGIRMIGWVAGNSIGHPIWPEVEPYIGRGGQYYDFFTRLVPPSIDESEHLAEGLRNVGLYREWFEKGQARPFDEDDNMDKIRRALQLAEEVVAVYR